MLAQKLEPILDSAGTDPRIMTADSLEPVLGERLRLNEYRQHFADEEYSQLLSQLLAESQPAFIGAPDVLISTSLHRGTSVLIA